MRNAATNISNSTLDDKLEELAALVINGHFDFTKRSKRIFTTWFLMSGWLAYASASFYFKIGADGTKYVPPSSFFENEKALGKHSAFWCNYSLNWYFMMATALEIREAFLNYQARKKLDLPYMKKELIGIGIKFSLALIMAGTTGAVFALIAGKDSDQPLWNQVIVGAVNVLLNFIGSVTLQNTILSGIHYLPYFKTKNNNNNSVTENIKSSMEKNLISYQRKPSDDNFWKEDITEADIITYLLQNSESTPFLSPVNKKNGKSTFTLPNVVYGIAWVGMQYCSLLSLLGWYLDTIKNVGEFGFAKFSYGDRILGTLFFSTFAFLSAKLAHETVKETIELGHSVFNKAKYIKENPSVMKHKDFKKTIPINLSATLLTTVGYFLSYVSSNSSLDLNADHGFKQPWNIIPTCIGTVTFNGFAFLLVFIGAATLAKKHIVDSSEKRNTIDRAEKIYSFINYNPGIIDTMSGTAVEVDLETQTTVYSAF